MTAKIFRLKKHLKRYLSNAEIAKKLGLKYIRRTTLARDYVQKPTGFYKRNQLVALRSDNRNFVLFATRKDRVYQKACKFADEF